MRAVPLYFWCPDAEVAPVPQPVDQYNERGSRSFYQPRLNCEFFVPDSVHPLSQGHYTFWTEALAREHENTRCRTHDQPARIFRQEAAYARRRDAVIHARYEHRWANLILPSDAGRGYPEGRGRGFWVEKRPDPVTLANIWRRS